MGLRKVVVGWCEGGRSRDALRFGSLLTSAMGAELVIAHVYRYDAQAQSSAVDVRMALRRDALHRLAQAEQALAYGMRARLEAVEARSVVQGLHDLAESEHADVVVLGATSKGSLELHAVGSIPERLLHGSPCAVAVAPLGFADEENPGLRVVGAAYDGTEESDNALALAREIAVASRATVKLIGVAEHEAARPVGPSTMYAMPGAASDYRDAIRRQLEAAAEALPHELRAQVILADGDPAAEIIHQAAPLSLLVMGSRGYGPIRRGLLGSVSAPVLRAAPCPVLVVPRGGNAPSAAVAAEVSA